MEVRLRNSLCLRGHRRWITTAATKFLKLLEMYVFFVFSSKRNPLIIAKQENTGLPGFSENTSLMCELLCKIVVDFSQGVQPMQI